MASLAAFADVVIGVDTHVETHAAAAVDARTGAVLDELTVPTTLDGNQELADLAGAHGPARVWAIEGTGAHGAGLARFLAAGHEVVVELDRPQCGLRADSAGVGRPEPAAVPRPEQGLHGPPNRRRQDPT